MLRLPTRDDLASSKQLAGALGWNGLDVMDRRVTRGGTELDTTRGVIAGQPAALFAVVKHRNGYDPLDSAALFGYHSALDWGLVGDEEGLTVFNTHWLKENDWYKVPTIPWDEVGANRSVLEAFAPEAIRSRDLQRISARWVEPTDFLMPVDAALVNRLDRWRDEALKYSGTANRVDDLLQVFYAQMFVLRTVEDRHLIDGLEPMSSIVPAHDKIDRQKWQTLQNAAREKIGSDLFDQDVTAQIPDHVLAGVIRDLYKPYGLPGRAAKYDFSWIDADVLGLAYEKYLATVLQPTSLPVQVDLFLPPERGVERHSVRKAAGAYYTPKYVTNYLSTRCVDEFFAQPGAHIPRVIDFACGSGSFLVAAVDKILRHLKARDASKPWAKELIEEGYIAGVDVDATAVTAARLHLWQRLLEEPDALPLPNLTNVVVKGDGLDRKTWGHLDKQYDVVLGNPPFLATAIIPGREQLEANFGTATGRYDFSSLFIEQALQVLNEKGLLGLVIPNRIFKNKSASSVRAMLTSATDILSIVDFGTNRPFDADAYVGCIIARKLEPDQIHAEKLKVVELLTLDAEFLTATLLDADRDKTDSAVLRSYTARHPRGGQPWHLLSAAEEIARIQIEEFSVALDSISSIPQGIRTGANDFFFFDVQSSDGKLSKVVNGLGESAVLEAELLEPSVYGSRVGRYQVIRPETRLLYPYRNNVALSEGELQANYPHAWAYFSRNRELLSSRASLKKTNGRFYELVWPRDERWLRSPKLLIRDLAPQTAFAVDIAGEVFLVSGTAVVPEDPEVIMPLMAYLNSGVIDALVRQTTSQFRGNFQKFEPQHIQNIPIIDRFLEDENFQGQLADLSDRAIRLKAADQSLSDVEVEIDALIAMAFNQRGVNLVR